MDHRRRIAGLVTLLDVRRTRLQTLERDLRDAVAAREAQQLRCQAAEADRAAACSRHAQYEETLKARTELSTTVVLADLLSARQHAASLKAASADSDAALEKLRRGLQECDDRCAAIRARIAASEERISELGKDRERLSAEMRVAQEDRDEEEQSELHFTVQ